MITASNYICRNVNYFVKFEKAHKLLSKSHLWAGYSRQFHHRKCWVNLSRQWNTWCTIFIGFMQFTVFRRWVVCCSHALIMLWTEHWTAHRIYWFLRNEWCICWCRTSVLQLTYVTGMTLWLAEGLFDRDYKQKAQSRHDFHQYGISRIWIDEITCRKLQHYEEGTWTSGAARTVYGFKRMLHC